MRDLVILGSTGSIGVQALEIVAANPGVFNVVAIGAYGSNPALIIEQARTYKVQVIGVVVNAEVIREALPGVTVVDGATAASEIAAITCEVVLNGITGSIGLGPTLAALEVGNKLALANKESLVAAGELTDKLARQVVEGVIAGEGKPAEVVAKRGIKVVNDDGALMAAIEKVCAEQAETAEKVRGGHLPAAGALIGAVMKETKGQADAARVRELLLGHLGQS